MEFGHDDMIDAETSAKPWSWEHLRLSLLRKMKPVAWLSKSSLQQLPGTSKALESFKLKQFTQQYVSNNMLNRHVTTKVTYCVPNAASCTLPSSASVSCDSSQSNR